MIDCKSPYDIVTTPGIAIISPNYPNGYPYDLTCQVTLYFDTRVSIEFESFWLTYPDHDTQTCDYDWLDVHDGNSSNSELIGSRLCGKQDIRRHLKST